MGSNKENRLRMEGFAMAVRIANEKGIDGLNDEAKIRGAMNIPCGVKLSEVEEFYKHIQEELTDYFVVASATVLHDKFGFGEQRVSRFMQQFTELSECVAGDFTTVAGLKEQMQEELGIEFVDGSVKSK